MWRLLLAIALIVLSGCGFATPTAPSPVAPTATLTPLPPTPAPTATPTSTPPAPEPEVARVYSFPERLYPGDWVSFSVEPLLPELLETQMQVRIDLPDGEVLEANALPQSLDWVSRARFYWAWNTGELVGAHWMTVTLSLPDSTVGQRQLVLPLTIAPPEEALPPELEARWAVTYTDGFNLHYLTHSAAERDLAYLVGEAQSAYEQVTLMLGHTDIEPVDIYLMDRVIGQGGYASSAWVAASYTERLYPPVGMERLFRHELTHRLDSGLGCDGTPALVREGLAVYVAGGHYWAESLPLKMSALLQTERYIPLERLAQNFYTHQHEISYLEAGALVAYVVETAGWEGVARLCTGARGEGDDGERLAEGLRAALDIESLSAFETVWLRWLRALQPAAAAVTRLQLEWRLMETLRDYQARRDPAAHFLEGILFDPAQAAQRGITADFVRRPRDAEAIALELLLLAARQALEAGRLERSAALLDALEAVLLSGFPTEGEAAEVLDVVAATLVQGYEPYHLSYDAARAGYRIAAVDYARWPTQVWLFAAREGGAWRISGPQMEE